MTQSLRFWQISMHSSILITPEAIINTFLEIMAFVCQRCVLRISHANHLDLILILPMLLNFLLNLNIEVTLIVIPMH